MIFSYETVLEKASKSLQERTKLSYSECKNAVSWLMLSTRTPTENMVRMDDTIPHIRYIHLIREGCLGFCGKKVPAFGPSELYDMKRLGKFGTEKGGFGGHDRKVYLFGVMYYGKNKLGGNHRTLARRYGVPAIYHHQKNPYRNQPDRPAVWGYFSPSNLNT